jgi:4-carboxymuconolactone decarboxylase
MPPAARHPGSRTTPAASARPVLIEQVAGVAPEIAGGYDEIRAAIATDGALPASTKALLVSVCAAVRGDEALARVELDRGRELGLTDREIADAGVSLLLARGEAACARFANVAGSFAPSPSPRAAGGVDPVQYFLDFFGVDELPPRMAIMASRAPRVFVGYQRMHHGALQADPAAVKLTELVLVAVNAADLATWFVGIHAGTARAAGVTDDELVEAVVCAIPVRGVAAWASAAEALFPAPGLEDRHAIEQLFVRYFDRVDANDPEGASMQFAKDLEFEIMIGKRKHGRERFARSLARVLARYERTSHHVSNIRTEFDGPDDAHGLAYVYAYHRMRDTGEPWHLWARMQDRYKRVDGRWLISEHVLLGLDAVPMRDDIPGDWYPGHPGRLAP